MNTYIRPLRIVLGTLAVTALAACQGTSSDGSGADGAGATTAAAGQGDTGGMPGMPGMSGMQGMQGSGMMASMQAHMDSMHGVTSGDRLERMLPMHRQMTANMLSEMNREMRSMNMSGDAAWTALMDSVRQDLRNLPELDRAQLASMMPAHRERVMRLMGMHRKMMQDMTM